MSPGTTTDAPVSDRRDVRLAPQPLGRILGWATVLGGLATILSILVPHADSTYDGAYVVVGVATTAFGALLLAAARRMQFGFVTIHAVLAILSAIVLLICWLGMHDLAGIQAVLLVITLSIAASIGPTWWAAMLAVLQSAGYAVVLATADPVLGFDKLGQWQVITLGLLVCLAFNVMVQRELVRTHELDDRLRHERDNERELHAEHLERLNEELQHTSELKSNFVAMASHELRTPLTAIEGFATTMQDRWDELSDDDKRTFVGVIDSQSQRLGRLVSDLLTVSRIESGRISARVQPTRVRDALERAILAVDSTGSIAVTCSTSVRTLADPDHLQQVLVNFLANALAYGRPPVEVVVLDELDAGTVRIDVVDCGPGIDPEFVPQLFDRFSRSPQAHLHGDAGGTGLGLSIVLGLVEANGGTVWYEPNEPMGARFCVRLPRAD